MAGPSGLTPNLALPYPVAGDDVDIPRDFLALATKLDVSGAVPIGALAMWLTGTPPADWLLCIGQTDVTVAAYPKLAAVLGSIGGAGTFVLMPDLRDRFPGGAGSNLGAVKATGGAASVTLLSSQSGLPGHSHSYAGATGRVPTNTIGFVRINVTHGSGPFNNNFVGYSGAGSDSSDVSTDSVAAANAAASHENRPPFYAVNFIIRAK